MNIVPHDKKFENLHVKCFIGNELNVQTAKFDNLVAQTIEADSGTFNDIEGNSLITNTLDTNMITADDIVVEDDVVINGDVTAGTVTTSNLVPEPVGDVQILTNLSDYGFSPSVGDIVAYNYSTSEYEKKYNNAGFSTTSTTTIGGNQFSITPLQVVAPDTVALVYNRFPSPYPSGVFVTYQDPDTGVFTSQTTEGLQTAIGRHGRIQYLGYNGENNFIIIGTDAFSGNTLEAQLVTTVGAAATVGPSDTGQVLDPTGLLTNASVRVSTTSVVFFLTSGGNTYAVEVNYNGATLTVENYVQLAAGSMTTRDALYDSSSDLAFVAGTDRFALFEPGAGAWVDDAVPTVPSGQTYKKLFKSAKTEVGKTHYIVLYTTGYFPVEIDTSLQTITIGTFVEVDGLFISSTMLSNTSDGTDTICVYSIIGGRSNLIEILEYDSDTDEYRITKSVLNYLDSNFDSSSSDVFWEQDINGKIYSLENTSNGGNTTLSYTISTFIVSTETPTVYNTSAAYEPLGIVSEIDGSDVTVLRGGVLEDGTLTSGTRYSTTFDGTLTTDAGGPSTGLSPYIRLARVGWGNADGDLIVDFDNDYVL